MSSLPFERAAAVAATLQSRDFKRTRHFVVGPLQELATEFFGDRGRFAYEAFRWANEALFNNAIPTPLIQWALTPYGACIGYSQSGEIDVLHPIITLHPRIWRGQRDGIRVLPHGERMTLDVVIHEMTHVHVAMMQAGGVRVPWTSSHDNDLWAGEVTRISPLIGLDNIVAARMKRKRVGKTMGTVPSDPNAISLKQSAGWPHTVRPVDYYDSVSVPFSWSRTDEGRTIRSAGLCS